MSGASIRSGFNDFAVRIMGEEEQPQAVAATIESGVSALETFFSRLGLPSRLSKLGVDAAQIPDIARVVTHAPDGSDRPLGVLKKIYEADAAAIYRRAI
jgi:alcohol dehydrogenase YqhD (iron-dependent ADH family)